jgi:energy-coupling factor transport system substrate-specific component
MSQTWVRAIVGVVAFAIVLIVGVNVTGAVDLTPDPKTGVPVGFNSVIALLGVALVVALVAYAATEYAQTRRLDSITSQFDTRTIVLIPIAIAINIILGQTVAAALKVPVYLDSIGTILVGVLAGPIAGALTGALANLIWTYILPAPFHSDYAAPFFIVAVEIGLLAGIFGRLGFFRSRPNTPPERLLVGAVAVVAILAVIGIYGFIPFYSGGAITFFAPPVEGAPAADPIFVILGWLVALLLVGAALALLAFLFIRRDLGAAYVFVAGLICGIVSALISAPISSLVFGGVTGSGTDLLVAAFQQAGDDLGTAVLKQGLLSDPIDKTLTFFVVFAILGALSRRFVARFPQGEAAVGLAES